MLSGHMLQQEGILRKMFANKHMLQLPQGKETKFIISVWTTTERLDFGTCNLILMTPTHILLLALCRGLWFSSSLCFPFLPLWEYKGLKKPACLPLHLNLLLISWEILN